MSNTELNKEILDILDNVIYWETCPKDYKVRIKAIKEQLPIHGVVFSEAELKVKLEEQLEETRQWLIGQDFEGLAERL